MTEYRELLQHPKWQEKRLRVLERAGFACEDCGSDEKTLHVHHAYYERGQAPWEYPDESLSALCGDCHRKAQVQEQVIRVRRQIGRLSGGQLEQVFGYTLACEHEFLDEESDPDVCFESAEALMGYADFLGVDWEKLAGLTRLGGTIKLSAIRALKS